VRRGVAGQHTIEALGEDLAWAIWHIAEPPSAVDSQTYGVAAPGQVERVSKVPAVLAPTQLATRRARHRFARRFGNEDQTAIALDNDQDDAPVLTLPAQRHDQSAPTSMPTLARSAADRKRPDICVIKIPGEPNRHGE
jgi:hypothetical protein